MSSGPGQIAVRPRVVAQATPETLVLDCADGRQQSMPIGHWLGPAGGGDEVLLGACAGATVDVGCGPGRMAAALGERGLVALGIDTSPTAVRLARERGAVALRRDVFGPLPGEGRWRHALLTDGNVGIGGDPVTLLRRLGALIGQSGSVLVETQPPGIGWHSDRVRIRRPGAEPSPWFGWAWVGVDALATVAGHADLRVLWTTSYADRWFAELVTHRWTG